MRGLPPRRELNLPYWTNRSTVLRLFYEKGPLSRRALVHLTGLMPSTITYITGDLLQAGLLRDLGQSEPRDPAIPGRRTTLLDLDPDSAFAVGVHLGVRGAHAVVTNLKAKVLDRTPIPLNFSLSPLEQVLQIADAVNLLITRTGINRQRVVGVGMGVVGWIDPMNGIVRKAPHDGWSDVPLCRWLSDTLDIPVCLDHNVRAMTIAEQLFGRGATVQNFILVTVGTVIGVGIVSNGQVIQGENFRSGQVGHVCVSEDGPTAGSNQRRCLDDLASDTAVQRRAIEWANSHPESALARLIGNGDHQRTPDRIIYAAARDGEPVANQIVTDTARSLGIGLSPLVAALDPGLIVVGGGITELGDRFFKPLRQAVWERCYSEQLTHVVPIEPPGFASTIDAAAVPVIGAASLAIKSFLQTPRPLTEWLAHTRAMTHEKVALSDVRPSAHDNRQR